jgi:hypothetical protein
MVWTKAGEERREERREEWVVRVVWVKNSDLILFFLFFIFYFFVVGTGIGLTGDYFDGDTTTTSFVDYKLTRIDPTINFSFGEVFLPLSLFPCLQVF